MKVFLASDGDEPFICAVNGECSISALTEIEESLWSEEHEFSSGPGEYVYEAVYDDGQWCLETGRCELAPYWEFTEIGFEQHEWVRLSDEPQTPRENPDGPCPNCGDVDCDKRPFNGCIPF
ncbi:hypothetical protein ACIGJK_03550 [Pseudomonas iridis]|uniref:hypothetical protein n=1 Tax=Pseudomonas iridis TaxID=2710587 RepID=UPI0037C56F28